MNPGTTSPFFSICIPQHNRTSFLLRALESFREQRFQDFEVCISDDCSNDGRTDELIHFLHSSGMRYKLKRQKVNLRYDGNLREAIGLASGRYILLMGNDDCLASSHVMGALHTLLQSCPSAGVVVTNFVDYKSGTLNVRVNKAQILKGNRSVAALNFRNLAFVSGLVLHRERAQRHATSRWDGSEMYQVFLAGRILSEGFGLIHCTQIAVLKDIQICGELVDNYSRRPVLEPCPILERRTPLVKFGQVACDGLLSDSAKGPSGALTFLVFAQILAFTYPYWILEYRRVQSWRYAAGICLGMRMANQLEGVSVAASYSLVLRTMYCVVTVFGLCAPLWIFDRVRPILYQIAKSALPWIGRSKALHAIS
jgi:hypothetical protein